MNGCAADAPESSPSCPLALEDQLDGDLRLLPGGEPALHALTPADPADPVRPPPTIGDNLSDDSPVEHRDPAVGAVVQLPPEVCHTGQYERGIALGASPKQ